MLKKYKKSFLIINTILILLFSFLVLNLLFLKQTSYLFCILSLLIPLSIIIAIYGYERTKRRYMYELIFYTFTYAIIILIITYILGIFIGFTRSIYKFNLDNLFHNIIPYLILIIISEIFRYEISRKGDGSITSYFLISLILIMIDMTIFLTSYNLNSGDGQIKYISAVMLPSLFKNVVLLYFSKLGGPVPILIYRILFDLRMFILPVFPNFGLYFESTFNCILPVLICVIAELHIRTDEKKYKNEIDARKKNRYNYFIFVFLFLISVSINFLSSGHFNYAVIAIGSGSMSPNIEKGDAVIYKKINLKRMPKVNDILVFKKNSKIIVHRIVKIVDGGNGDLIYYTKGDANENADGYPIEYKDMIGTVKFKFRYFGIPSVILGEALN